MIAKSNNNLPDFRGHAPLDAENRASMVGKPASAITRMRIVWRYPSGFDLMRLVLLWLESRSVMYAESRYQRRARGGLDISVIDYTCHGGAAGMQAP